MVLSPAINRTKVDAWKNDIGRSVDFYNEWFLAFAPKTFRSEREKARRIVADVFDQTNFCRDINAAMLVMNPVMLPVLRQMTCPPLARDRLAGLAGVKASLKCLENMDRPPKAVTRRLLDISERVLNVLRRMFDTDILTWLNKSDSVSKEQIARASLVIADRVCGAASDPIIRIAQEKRQLATIARWLRSKGYRKVAPPCFQDLNPGEYAFHLNVKVDHSAGEGRQVNIPVDVAIQPHRAEKGGLPIMLEAKSAGDFTNVNKRRKEEAQKISQLKGTYGSDNVRFILFLCGYFDSGYLGYEAAEGIDWIWEHRISDMEELGL